MTSLSKLVTLEVFVSAVAIGFITTFAICWYQRNKKQKAPTDWEPVGVVKKLYVYPLKSGKGIELDTALCTDVGVKVSGSSNLYPLRDRSFVVYNEKEKKFLTARQIPTLVLIKTAAVDHDHITLTGPNMPILVIKVPNSENNQTVTITQHHGEKFEIVDCGDESAKWISKYAAEDNLRIGYNEAKRRRNLKPTHQKYLKVYPRLRSEATGLQSDFTSYMLMNESSVKDLQEKITEANVTHSNFRPNILIDGPPAFAEDNWEWIKIGDVILYTAKPCTRCILTTINPNTGIKSDVNEPLKTLRTYRLLKDLKNISLDGSIPWMGLNMGYHSGERINVGDVVYAGK